MNELRCNESPEKRQERLSNVTKKMNELRSNESPQKRQERLSNVTKKMNELRSNESPKRDRNAYLMWLRRWMN